MCKHVHVTRSSEGLPCQLESSFWQRRYRLEGIYALQYTLSKPLSLQKGRGNGSLMGSTPISVITIGFSGFPYLALVRAALSSPMREASLFLQCNHARIHGGKLMHPHQEGGRPANLRRNASMCTAQHSHSDTCSTAHRQHLNRA